MKRLIRTTLSLWDMNPFMIEQLRKSLEEVGTVTVASYRSKFHILFPDYGGIKYSTPSPLDESNHIEYLLNGVVIIQLFRVIMNVTGRIFTERIPLNVQERVEEILAAYGLYTGKMARKHAPWIPLLLLLSAVLVLVSLFTLGNFLNPSTVLGKVVIALCAVALIGGICQFWQYSR